jgi:hypothetical protein
MIATSQVVGTHLGHAGAECDPASYRCGEFISLGQDIYARRAFPHKLARLKMAEHVADALYGKV